MENAACCDEKDGSPVALTQQAEVEASAKHCGEIWQLVPGLFRWAEVAAMVEEGTNREIRASRTWTDSMGQGLYRVYVLMAANEHVVR